MIVGPGVIQITPYIRSAHQSILTTSFWDITYKSGPMMDLFNVAMSFQRVRHGIGKAGCAVSTFLLSAAVQVS